MTRSWKYFSKFINETHENKANLGGNIRFGDKGSVVFIVELGQRSLAKF